jgi:transposase InsO family protein
MSRTFRLTTDASVEGLGAILSQVNDDGDEQVIAYASRSLTTAERNYNVTELELLAIVWALHKYRPYIYGVDQFQLVTDHQALTYLNSLSEKSQRLTRWKLLMQEYNYVFLHRPGRDNMNADALSRIPQHSNRVIGSISGSKTYKANADVSPAVEKRRRTADDIDIQCHNSAFNIIGSIGTAPELTMGLYDPCPIDEEPPQFDDEHIRDAQDNDPTITELKGRIIKDPDPKYEMIGGILFHKQSNHPQEGPCLQLVIPETMVRDALIMSHEGFAGHLGINKTFARVNSKFYWPTMTRDTKNFVESCETCSGRKSPTGMRATLGTMNRATKPFETISMDFLGPLPTTINGNTYLLVITDFATRWVEAFPTRDMKATTVAQILINEVFCRHSAPENLLSDQGRSFVGEVIKEVCRLFMVNKIQTVAYRPQQNGLTENFNKTICQMLSAYINDDQTNWDIFLPIILFAYRTSKHKTTGETPFRLLYGRDARLPHPLDQWSPNQIFVDQIQDMWEKARIRTAAQAEKSTEAQAKNFKELPSYETGELVNTFEPATKPGRKTKLRGDLWQGPYTVEEVSGPTTKIRGRWYHNERVKPHITRYGRLSKKPTRLGIDDTG